MKKERDSQRGKLYKAEKVLEAVSQRLETVAEMTAYKDKVFARAPIQARYGDYLKRSIEVRDGAGCRSALGDFDWIKMPKWSRTEYLVLHELAHSITRRRHGEFVAGHGRAYAAIYLDLVRFGMGAEAADMLKASFKAHRVRYTPKRGAPPAVLKRAPPLLPPKPPKPARPRRSTMDLREYNAFRKIARANGITYSIERESGTTLAWITFNPFGAFVAPWTTMHHDWYTTVDRLERCIAEPGLVCGGEFSE